MPAHYTFGINGFGRIGRTSLRVWWLYHRDKLNLGCVNTSGSMDLEEWVHLLRFDSNYGVFDQPITIQTTQSKSQVTDDNPLLGYIQIGDSTIAVTAQRDPEKIPWSQFGVQTVIESTGVFLDQHSAGKHLLSGAKTVIISAPAKGEGVSTSVLGVNQFAPDSPIRSNASCTTNSVAPIAQVIHQSFGIEKAILTTIHSYTDDQNLQDNSHHKDLRRARSAAINIIPTSTGAAKATAEVIPDLKGKFDGMAVRVPTSVGSLSDITFLVSRPVTVQQINQALIDAANQPRWQNILGVTNYPIVSSDVIGRKESSIVDLSLTQVVGGNLVKIISWYDNEWGYCNRLVEQIYT